MQRGALNWLLKLLTLAIAREAARPRVIFHASLIVTTCLSCVQVKLLNSLSWCLTCHQVRLWSSSEFATHAVLRSLNHCIVDSSLLLHTKVLCLMVRVSYLSRQIVMNCGQNIQYWRLLLLLLYSLLLLHAHGIPCKHLLLLEPLLLFNRLFTPIKQKER